LTEKLTYCTKVLETGSEGKKVPQALVDLGARHVKYGAKPEHFAIVAEALMWAIKHQMEEHEFVKTAHLWEKAIQTIASYMIKGMEDPKYKVNSECPIQ